MGSFGALHWFIFAGILSLIVYSMYRLANPGGKTCVCPECGTVSKPQSKTKGNMAIEIILWLTFIIPGLIYSIWRLTSQYKACPGCGSDHMIPIDTPTGKKLYEQTIKMQ